ncbi:NAD(P)-dependent alcohol dehydrogenase [Candidatus Clostridium stratigraminis]|uniref:NAD(P)-dependent alcohol dehydrogenase n=1 Tax=Candidatus Clostridium stratigraminis TaxID=3381661 RepID=A0ABW8T8U6_9CLOT
MKLNKMKAITRTEYGSSDVFKLKEVDVPSPKDNEILIRVYATTVNRTDCAILSGKPFIMRFFTGLLKPDSTITGTDFAGQIEFVGKSVTNFKIGDRVFGFNDTGLGSHAQYMTVSEDKAVAIIPNELTYEEAAASLEGAHYAYNCINKVNLRSGQKVLVNGGTGAIGSSLVQFLKYFDTYVTAVSSTENIELVKSLGADKVIDYTKEDFTQDTQEYHFIFDSVGKSSFAKCKPLLQPDGVYISTELGYMAQNLFLAFITSKICSKKVIFPVPTDIKGTILFIKDLIEKQRFKPVIDRRYPLDKIHEAYNYVATGQKIGNVIITF